MFAKGSQSIHERVVICVGLFLVMSQDPTPRWDLETQASRLYSDKGDMRGALSDKKLGPIC